MRGRLCRKLRRALAKHRFACILGVLEESELWASTVDNEDAQALQILGRIQPKTFERILLVDKELPSL